MMETCQFKVRSLEEMCFKFLRDHLCPENCIGRWQFTNAWNIPITLKLQYEAFHFICENFETVALCEEFLQLEVQELAVILGQDDLTVSQEHTVYESVLRWINHMPGERHGAIGTLLPKVRLGLMDTSYIMDNVLGNDLVKTNPESHLLVSNILEVMSKPLLSSSERGINNALFCRRLPNTVLLMVKHYYETIEAFDHITKSWLTVATHHRGVDPMTPSGFHRPVFLGGYLYIVGGGLSWLISLNIVKKFNLVTHTWQEVSPMHESRAFLSVTVLKRCIYAMGGCRLGTSLRTAECYQPDINQWTFIASMNDKRRNASCSTLNNKIYICGGGNDYIDLNTAECYNPDTNQWTLITPMGTPRYRLGVVAYMGHIFAVGGRNGYLDLRSAEAYDPVTNTWHDVAGMVHRHSNFGIAVMDKQIFVVSCWTGKKVVECYDFTTDSWSVVFFHRDYYYHSVSCCVISRLPNMAEYRIQTRY